MNLELNFLTLSCRDIPYPERSSPLCTEVVSKHGLEKMPGLQRTKLIGGFAVRF